MLETVIYLSSAKISFTRPMLDALLQKARVRNEQLGVTGVLIYGENTFVQAIEGSPDAIDECLGRIMLDDRHSAIDILHRGPIEARGFEEWRMGFAHADDTADGLFELTRDKLFAKSTAELSEPVEELLSAFQRTLRASARY